ncbi:MAG: ribonuclease D [Planctomycetota bacterium]|nr:MAG: ribonuclease D [Planctomycetota bacterium]
MGCEPPPAAPSGAPAGAGRLTTALRSCYRQAVDQAPVLWVDDAAALAALVAALEQSEAVAFDTEFHPEQSYTPQLMLVQLRTPAGAALVDPLAVELQPLLEALGRPGLTCIGHAAAADVGILLARFGRAPAELFDTQLAAAFAGHGLQLSLAELSARVLGRAVCKRERFTDWSQRPLTAAQRRYALGDVEPLLELRERLERELERRGVLCWFRQDAARLLQPQSYARSPEQLAERLRGAERLSRRELAQLYALLEERERLAAAHGVPRRRIAADRALLVLARRAPRTLDELRASGLLHEQQLATAGQPLLAALERARALPAAQLPAPLDSCREGELGSRLGRLRALLERAAARTGLPAPLIASVGTLRRALRAFAAPDGRAAAAPQQALAQLGLDGWRAEVLGPELLAALRG